MAQRREPKVFVLGGTTHDTVGVPEYLAHIGASDWTTDPPSPAEGLTELIGRACYRSYAPGLNPNVTRVRNDNASYIKNIVASRHGSVLEHAWVTFALCDVSRVFTHELVRHRVGTAISQESLRFVRADELRYWVPRTIENAGPEAVRRFEQRFIEAEEDYKRWIEIFAKEGQDFEMKKHWTSAIRRVLPDGMATTIVWSCNMRTLRHVIESRTDPAAEEEIRYVFGMVAAIALERWPNIFADYVVSFVDGYNWYHTENRKV